MYITLAQSAERIGFSFKYFTNLWSFKIRQSVFISFRVRK
jgi:hypothetical protein